MNHLMCSKNKIVTGIGTKVKMRQKYIPKYLRTRTF